jgi:F-type H+-transporting ATPase subunit epsilon
MNLKVLLPFEVFAQKTGVMRIVAESLGGSFGLLPNRLDCAAALVPGILVYETSTAGTVYLAVDEGVLVKCGPDVLVSVRRAIGGKDLAALHDAVTQEFLLLDSRERDVRSAISKMEASLMGRLADLQHER